jgi:EAL domain-containing protein (putative c-di-GMP-specific phosphodiesterase class I)
VDANHESELDVEQVLTDSSLRIAFQPIFRLSLREVIGYEALSRFPGQADANPVHWFEQAARLGFLQQFELLAVKKALEQLVKLPEGTFISVNISPSTAASKAFGELAVTVPPSRLVLEITEAAAVNNYHRFAGPIDRLRSLGVRIALDDAGGSDVSLQHLLLLQPDIVKIDTTVIHGIADDEVRQAVACAYVAMSEREGALSLAEGIETDAEFDTLTSLGVEIGQGYLLGRPAFLED